MKELSIEEKAKRYDIALDKIKMLLGTDSSCSREELKYVFPELAESDDEMFRKYILKCCEETISADCGGLELSMNTTIRLKNWLEKQGKKESVTCPICGWGLEKQGEQEHAEWSEEDEQTFIESVEALEDFGKFELADWLKEHKNKSLRPQTTWKPSDEQIRPLEYAIDYFRRKKNDTTYLKSLYQDLMKLRED